jgi:hypothetical protein
MNLSGAVLFRLEDFLLRASSGRRIQDWANDDLWAQIRQRTTAIKAIGRSYSAFVCDNFFVDACAV